MTTSKKTAWPTLALALSLLAAGCAGGVDRIPPTIFNGELDLAHPSVGSLFAGRPTGTGASFVCTATLVGEQTVLTAAHCIGSLDAQYSVRLDGLTHAADRVTIHPQYTAFGIGAAPYEAYAYDVAVLRLTARPEVDPTPIATAMPFVGQAITLVGYGGRPPAVDPPVDDGVKPEPAPPGELERHAATNRIHTVRSEYFVYELVAPDDGNICSGDSGGPTFAMVGGIEAQIGVHSQSRCRDGGGADRRVDVHASWIQQAADGDVVVVTGSGDGQPADDGLAPEGKPSPPGDGDTTPGQKQLPGGDSGAADSKQPLPESPADKQPPGADSGTPEGKQPPAGDGQPGAPCSLPADCASGQCIPGAKGAQCA